MRVKIRTALTVLFCLGVLLTKAEDVLVCYPHKRVLVSEGKITEEKLTTEQSKKNAIIITKKNEEYIWKTRGNHKLAYSKSGIFHIFNDTQGAGYVKLDKDTVIEHVHLGLTTYTYFGRIQIFKLEANPSPFPIPALLARAKKGDATAQWVVAEYYLTGKGGMEKNPDEAFKWLLKSAKQGNHNGQLGVGMMCLNGKLNGRGVEQDFVWIDLAAANGNEKAMKPKLLIANKFNSTELFKAQSLAKEMVEKNPKLIKK
jgi:hypothetical protein